MNLISLEFFVFIIIGLLVFWATPEIRRSFVLLILNVLFIISFNYFSLITLFVIAFVTFMLGKKYRITKSKFMIVLGVIFVIAAMIGDRVILFETMERRIAVDSSLVSVVGISFWGLQAISYLCDLYSGKITQDNSFLNYCVYLSLFANLTSGPIERADRVMSQIGGEQNSGSWKMFIYGCLEILYGCFLKLIIGERLALIVDCVYGHITDFAGVVILLAVLSYSFQIYCDFSGYTYIVVGIAKLFGIRLGQNFEQPYFSKSISEFWRRWHISLSSWFRDYVYIPLGGNRKGIVRKYLNIFIVFMLSGLWHGMGKQFIVWGGMHGAFQIIGGLTSGLRKKIKCKFHIDETTEVHKFFQMITTFCLVTIAWIFFRAPSIQDALSIMKRMVLGFDLTPVIGNVHLKQNNWHQGIGRNLISETSIFEVVGMGSCDLVILCCGILCVIGIDCFRYQNFSFHKWFERQNWVFRWIFSILVIAFIAIFGLYGGEYQGANFIYSNF